MKIVGETVIASLPRVEQYLQNKGRSNQMLELDAGLSTECSVMSRPTSDTRPKKMPAEKKRIAVIPGDGIGAEVIAEALRVLERVKDTHDVELELVHFDWGADKFLREGVSLPTGRAGNAQQ